MYIFCLFSAIFAIRLRPSVIGSWYTDFSIQFIHFVK